MVLFDGIVGRRIIVVEFVEGRGDGGGRFIGSP